MIKWILKFFINNTKNPGKLRLQRMYCKRYGHTWNEWYPTGFGSKLRYCKRCPDHEEETSEQKNP